MIFSSTFDKVMDGTKTQTRRPVKINHGNMSFPNSPKIEVVVKSHWNKKGALIHRKLWQVGETYAVQPGRGKKSEGRIKITKIRCEKLMDISIHDCIAEGIETTPGEAEGAHVPEHRERFAELWDSLYKGTEYEWRRNPNVWVLEFELVEKY